MIMAKLDLYCKGDTQIIQAKGWGLMDRLRFAMAFILESRIIIKTDSSIRVRIINEEQKSSEEKRGEV